MRKLILFATVLTFNLANAQQPSSNVKLIPPNPRVFLRSLPKPTPGSSENPLHAPAPSAGSKIIHPSANLKTAGLRESEAIIGNTQYDLQTNRSIDNRLLLNSDGTLSATWTTLCVGGDFNTDRGTGYNYFNGTTWQVLDCNKIEPINRTGFTNIGVTSSGKEFVIAHSSTAGGMVLTSRPAKGTGSWTENPSVLGNNPNDTWAKMVVGGTDNNSVHAIWQTTNFGPNAMYCGQLGAVAYSRSTDGGVTWPVLHECLAAIDTPYYLGFSADDYSIASQGNNVAIVVGDWTTDLVLLKSTDNGDTWTKQILWSFYKPLYDDMTDIIDTNEDGVGDIIAVPDGDVRVDYDNTGMLHVVFSKVYVSDMDVSTAIAYYPDADGGIWYWDESMGTNPPILIAAAEDLNGDGILNVPLGAPPAYFGSGTYGGGLSLEPTIGFDESNNMFVTYSTFDELADTVEFNCGRRHVYVIASYDHGLTWTTPFDIVPTSAEGGDGEYEEAVFACMARTVTDKVHIIYQRDQAPGHSLSNLPDEVDWNSNPSDIVYAAVEQSDLTSAPSVKSVAFEVSQNIPNPVSDQTVITFTLPKASEIKVDVYDVVGQKVVSVPSTTYSNGQHSIKIDCNNLPGGVYFYEVSAGSEKITRKMIVD